MSSPNQNPTKLRPLPQVLLRSFSPGDVQALSSWFDALVRQATDPNQLAQNQVSDLETDLDTNATAISTHTALTEAHGSTGDLVGTGDTATELVAGVVLKAATVSDGTSSTVSVDSADATDLATVITLANENKADTNTLVTDLNSAITQLNALITSLRSAGVIT